MASSQLLPMTKWSLEKDLWLRDFVGRHSLPHLALATKGQHLSMGAPKVSSPSLIPYVLLHSTHRVRHLAAQAVQVKEGRPRKVLQARLSVPESFAGLFDMVSEDGRGGAELDVAGLCRAFPEQALVRAPCKAQLADSDGELRSLQRTRSLAAGELLTLVGQFNLHNQIFLRCFDPEGASVYLKLSSRGRFSPLAGPDSLAGLHSPASLLRKRLPLTVRLVKGTGLPPELDKFQSAGTLAFQLLHTFTEELVIAHSVSATKPAFHAIPLNAHIKLAPARNHNSVRCSNDFQRLVASCEEKLPSLVDALRPCSQLPPPWESAEPPPADPHHDPAQKAAEVSADQRLRRTLRDELGEELAGEAEAEQPPVSDGEIEQLYDYIRGLGPLPDSCQRPAPPPLHTIPSRRSDSLRGSSGALRRLPPDQPTADPLLRPRSGARPQASSGPAQPSTSAARPEPSQRFAEPRPPQPRSTEAHSTHSAQRPRSKSSDKASLLTASRGRSDLRGELRGEPRPPLRAAGQRKQRPLSMVLPDQQAQFFFPHYAPPYFHQSFANVSLSEDAAAYLDMSSGAGLYGGAGLGRARPPPRPPPQPSALFPRFAPRYALHPPLSYRIG